MPTLTAPRPTPTTSAPMLFLLVALFLLPLLIGNGLYWLGWRPQQMAHHGELLQPPPTLPDSGLRHADGRPLASAELRGKWLLLLPVDAGCDADCRSRLQQLRQVHIALNKEQARVKRVLLLGAATGEPALAQLQEEFPDLVVARLPADDERWQRAIARRAPSLYVVDPLANVVLRYAGPSEMRGVLKDLERLLKYSWLR